MLQSSPTGRFFAPFSKYRFAFGLKSMKFFAAKVKSVVPFENRNPIVPEEFSAKIKNLRPENCPWRVYLTYIYHLTI